MYSVCEEPTYDKVPSGAYVELDVVVEFTDPHGGQILIVSDDSCFVALVKSVVGDFTPTYHWPPGVVAGIVNYAVGDCSQKKININ